MEQIFPWYDSDWLSTYVRAKRLIQSDYPQKYAEFVDTFYPLKTRLDFETIDDLFDRETFGRIEESIAQLTPAEIEQHELFKFGRFVVHDYEYFTQLHQLIAPSCNFLSLYNNLGICRIHLDATNTEYTLDVCVNTFRSVRTSSNCLLGKCDRPNQTSVRAIAFTQYQLRIRIK